MLLACDRISGLEPHVGQLHSRAAASTPVARAPADAAAATGALTVAGTSACPAQRAKLISILNIEMPIRSQSSPICATRGAGRASDAMTTAPAANRRIAFSSVRPDPTTGTPLI